jgi:hypothetical protein
MDVEKFVKLFARLEPLPLPGEDDTSTEAAQWREDVQLLDGALYVQTARRVELPAGEVDPELKAAAKNPNLRVFLCEKSVLLTGTYSSPAPTAVTSGVWVHGTRRGRVKFPDPCGGFIQYDLYETVSASVEARCGVVVAVVLRKGGYDVAEKALNLVKKYQDRLSAGHSRNAADPPSESEKVEYTARRVSAPLTAGIRWAEPRKIQVVR